MWRFWLRAAGLVFSLALRLTVVCAYNGSDYPAFLESVVCILGRELPGDSTFPLGDFRFSHVGYDGKTFQGLIGRNGLPYLNPSGVLLDLCAGYGLAITNTMLMTKVVHKCT